VGVELAAATIPTSTYIFGEVTNNLGELRGLAIVLK
jgi:hypothetical protein